MLNTSNTSEDRNYCFLYFFREKITYEIYWNLADLFLSLDIVEYCKLERRIASLATFHNKHHLGNHSFYFQR